jgi:hypothetical protein
LTYKVPAITGATSYIWTLPTGATGTSTSDTISVSFGNSAVSGNITVKGHNSSGDGTESSKGIIVNRFPLAAGTITGNSTVCKDTSNVIYGVSAISGAISYIWTLPTGATGSSTTESISINFDNTATSGDIKVKGRNNCGDGTESTMAIIVKNTCGSTSIDNISSSDNIKVYPNPTTGMCEISINEALESGFKIKVFNSLGSIVNPSVKQKGKKSIEINLSVYPSGIYLIRINSKYKSYQSRLIKN